MDKTVRFVVKLLQHINIGNPTAFQNVVDVQINTGGGPEENHLSLDLIANINSSLHCPPLPEQEEDKMGQTSSIRNKPKISLTWALKSAEFPIIANNNTKPCNVEINKNLTLNQFEKSNKNSNITHKLPTEKVVCEKVPKKYLGVSKLANEKRYLVRKAEDNVRSVSPSSSTSTVRPGRRRRVRRPRPKVDPKIHSNFGYEIQDLDEFLTKASLENPGNIPMVLSTQCVLYQTQVGMPQREVSLPLGMVINAVLKNQAWLYVQTPHGEEGYVPYACCIPLGILPPPSRAQPCWDTQTDIFPRPSGNRTDNEKMRDGTKSECGARITNHRNRIRQDSLERSVDNLYLKASKKTPTRYTLLVIAEDYSSKGRNSLSVCKGDVVSLVSSHLKDWFWVRDRNGKEGFIPAVVAGHGFL